MENIPAQDYQQEEEAQKHMAQVTENIVEGTKGWVRNHEGEVHQEDSENEWMYKWVSDLVIFHHQPVPKISGLKSHRKSSLT